jgi:gas vesicle protein
MKKSINFTQVAVTVAASVAVGAIIGMLFAPKNGSDLRKKIISEKDNMVKAMENKFDSFLAKTKKELATETNELKTAIDDKL